MTFRQLLNAAKTNNFLNLIHKPNGVCRIREIEEMRRYFHNPLHHPEGHTVYEHTIAAVRTYKGTNPVTRLAVLFHDLGKIAVANRSASGPWHNFYGHDKEGSDVFTRMVRRYDIPESVAMPIDFCIRNHMRFHKITEMDPKKVYELVSSPYWSYLVSVGYCDEFCRGDVFESNKTFHESCRIAEQLRYMKGARI